MEGECMNKSVKYIEDRIINTPNSINIPISGWDKAIVFNPIEQYLCLLPELKSCFISDKEFSVVLISNNDKINITIEYNSDVEFDYFTTITTTHDGTLFFIEEAIQELLIKLLKLETHAKNKITSEFIENPFNYNVKYTIGDIIMHTDYGMKNINGNKIHGETNNIVLPIKFDTIKR